MPLRAFGRRRPSFDVSRLDLHGRPLPPAEPPTPASVDEGKMTQAQRRNKNTQPWSDEAKVQLNTDLKGDTIVPKAREKTGIGGALAAPAFVRRAVGELGGDITKLDLVECCLTGELPESIGQLTALTTLDLSFQRDGGFTGTKKDIAQIVSIPQNFTSKILGDSFNSPEKRLDCKYSSFSADKFPIESGSVPVCARGGRACT